VAAVNAIGASFALMHCTSTYPTPFDHVQLGCIGELRARYHVPVGLSDHTLGNYMAFAAAALGANLFEKHFTVSRSLPGPDQQGSMEPAELADLVRGVRAIEQALGATKQIQPGGQDVRNMAHHSIVSIRDIAAGATMRRRGPSAPDGDSGAAARRDHRPRTKTRDRQVRSSAGTRHWGGRETAVLDFCESDRCEGAWHRPAAGDQGHPGKNIKPLAAAASPTRSKAPRLARSTG
jgi:hypothetical protein